MENSLLLSLDYCRGIKIGQVYEIKNFAFFSETSIYSIQTELPATENLALSIRQSASGWQLLNLSKNVHCAVNGMPIASDNWCLLHDGDIFEWGLSIWQINPAQQFTPEIETETLNKNNADYKIMPLDLKWFDSHLLSQQKEENPFSLVMPSLPYELLESKEYQTKDSTLEESPAEAIFLDLLHEYRQALDTPQLSVNEHFWQERLLKNDVSSSASTVNLADLSGNLDPLMTLQDIVSGPLNIDDVFNGLDSLREAELFKTEEIPEILHLFAPGWQQQNSHAHMPPTLTRKEHHAVSVDSHYRMSQFADSHQKDFKDEPHTQK